jgi:ATP-dependent exoDNAse (exonuclease V) alpha subunit
VFSELRGIHELEALKSYIPERAILTPLNDNVDELNELISDRVTFGGPNGQAQKRTYYSADELQDCEDENVCTVEYLNTLSISGIPPHKLHLQVGCPIMLLRNMTGGLANGTRLIVVRLMDHVVEAEVITGPDVGKRVCIPRLKMTPSETDKMPFKMCRLQFPVRTAFAMTINKAQGQTLNKVGIYLPKPVFSHGQLYVALSRVGTQAGVKVLVKDGWRPNTRNDAGEAPEGVYTTNVVYREVFRST